MVQVSVSQIIHDESGDLVRLLAQFSVDEAGIHPEAGDRCDVIAAIPVVDPETGDRLTSEADPLRWARLLPQALRSGDLVALVEEVETATSSTSAKRDGIAVLAAEAVEGSMASAAEPAH
ncbi:MAG TPA: hypothetical protein VJL81_18030 [Solirubrobacterales bacterium]|nr:hypothetical protein [Solirubrobacterales bacterium]